MSSVAKGAGKVFRKVASVAKKVAPYALAAGAIYFTAGAALGVSGAAGGWGAVAGGLSSSMSLGATMTPIVTGALTQAGYGAAIGAGVSALTGGSIAKGALMGAAGGAVTGGVTGGLGFGTDPLASTGVSGGNAAPAAATPGMSTLAAPAGAASAPGAAAVSGAPLNVTAGASAGPGGSGMGFGSMFDKGGWLERNQTLVGQTASGVGTGLLQGMTTQDRAEALKEHDERIAGNYRVTSPAANPSTGGNPSGFGFYTGPAAQTNTGAPSPAQKFDRVASGKRYAYTPGVGMRLVAVS